MAKANEFRDQSIDELKANISDLYQKLFFLRGDIQGAAGQPEQPHRLKEMRRTLARALTILRERQLLEERS